MHDKIKPSVLQAALETACKGTSVTTRELVKELTVDEIAEIKSGDITAADLVNLVLELADNKDNATLYRIKVKNNESDNSPDIY
tara:strand:+ start:1227 stop:1478 length:252 start_codon:yes stop_codon:yes gene_type:complete